MTQTLRKPPVAPASHTVLLPEGWPPPRGYVNGILARGETIYLGGMIGWDTEGRFPEGFVAQARQALTNIATVLQTGGAGPEHIVRMTWYVVDMAAYRSLQKELGAAYREVIGNHYPAMALVEVRSLVEPDALVEIEVTAVIQPV